MTPTFPDYSGCHLQTNIQCWRQPTFKPNKLRENVPSLFKVQSKKKIYCWALNNKDVGGQNRPVVAFSLRAQLAWVQVTAPEFISVQKFSDVAVLIDSALLRTSGQCKKLNIVV